ncbi:MAG: hypothetical protein ACD_3C00210G0003 [uncultured bacterium (gcode 4)]|uniref:LamG-like jellyroll fold domain-containing protein n=1 Tax=uncultured bacterium (gcode 4) TaxID=1234023 RepID=K2FWR0_9BACT|nr:MAG: hypothetical protein ACD_3C00210G0003 [uncultured bacterium (gcode 4)]
MITKNNNAFTLVELIVVIVILAILATIAFLSFSNQSSWARDSARLSDISSIRKWIEVKVAVGWVIPVPANPAIYAWASAFSWITWVTISAWTINNSILPAISAWIKDPSWTEYKYSTISKWWAPLFYQIAIELENPISHINKLNPFNSHKDSFTSFWDSATSKVTYLKWSYSFDPSLPSLFLLTGSTAPEDWWIFNPDICFVLNNSTTNTISNASNCIQKKNMALKDYDSWLIAMWDMQTTESSWWITYLKDISGNWWNGKCYGDNTLSWSCWSVGPSFVSWGMLFNWMTWSSIKILNSTGMLAWEKQMTIIWKMSWYCNTGWNCAIIRAWANTASVKSLNFRRWIVWWELSTNNLNYKNLSSTITVAEGSAAFWAMTYDWSKIKIYLNWNLTNQAVLSWIISTSNWDWYMWKITPTDPNWTFSGTISEVKIYNRALSDSEIYQQAKSAWF